MPELDAKVASVLDRAGPDSDDEDALIASLEKDEDASLSAFRERRLQQLHEEVNRAKALRSSDHGTFLEVKDEKSLMDITTQTKLCVVHFFKPDFNRCGIMDRHLETLAPKHYDTRFLRINVENAPFLVTKLKVQVLPCVIAFMDGKQVDRIIGFEGLGYTQDSFTTKDLESRLLEANVLVRSKLGDEEAARRGFQPKKQVTEYEDDDDWD
ncbi:thioredoxin-like protein [Pseudovirgaria hyperparasitica]|uniref:Thioredoxin-like protein n=1 Tax=Pseudovirgaria hyperparasitica TaxID=470096 RepID=A0A6A6W4E0_9PEZI|nr:thioredoxin-like protein [Pseudovirgaria hyperparasitica]KAF2755911.1 thioredoxin-like protein [Pseudovirgaria hyperparasitica]